MVAAAASESASEFVSDAAALPAAGSLAAAVVRHALAASAGSEVHGPAAALAALETGWMSLYQPVWDGDVGSDPYA